MNAPTEAAVARERLIEDFRSVVADTEELLRATASQTGERIGAVRSRLEASLSETKARLAEIEQGVVERARFAARETDAYVREHPWQTAGVSAAIGVLLGMLLGSRR